MTVLCLALVLTGLEGLRDAGWDAAYRTDYAAARARFTELARVFPRHPAGDLALASVTWQEYLFQQRRLSSSVYSKDSKFYAGASRTKEGSEGEAVEPAADLEFQGHLGRAMEKAQAMVDARPESAEALYYLGAVYGVRAAYAMSAQRRFMAALRDGVRSVKLHQRVIALDPSFVDAYLTLGTYHYAVGCVPQPFRMIATMAGVRGGKAKGMGELELVVRKGGGNREDARAVLIALYRYEGRPGAALAELEAYSAKYPENLLVRVERGATLAQMRRAGAAALVFEELLRGKDQRVRDLVLVQYGEALALEGSYLLAGERFGSVEAGSPLAGQAYVRAGQCFDLAGKRGEAVRFYRAYLGMAGSEEGRKSVEEWVQKGYRTNPR